MSPHKWGVISELQEKTRFDHAMSISYSQAAEDLVLSVLLGGNTGFYVDVGAHHPSRFSVTRLLYQKGWCGINIDANPGIDEEFRKYRPRDLFINAAVGNSKTYKYYRFNEPAINTIDGKWMKRFVKEGNQIKDTIEVPGVTLRKIFDSVPIGTSVNLLNVDIEGADLEALRSLKIESLSKNLRPQWILIESTPPLKNVLKTSSVKHLLENGYEIYCVMPMATLMKNKTIP